eukprot:Em0019g84a
METRWRIACTKKLNITWNASRSPFNNSSRAVRSGTGLSNRRLPCVVPSDDPPDTAYGLENDMYAATRHYLCNKSEACSSFNPSQEDGLYIDDMSRVDAIESDMTNIVAIERQMDRCLIQLQTLASIVSLALRRTELPIA